ncbi:MAG TPA: shikimate dehydrogenase [Candidatus Acidoferrales bacterium]|nr:shikimate dehydrogenase [Candidatus Acidoferrales bacterium]
MGFGKYRICAVVAASTAAEMTRQLRQALRYTRTIELRLDWLASDTERQKLSAWLGRRRIAATFIATCRRKAAGGRFTGDVAQQLVILQRAVRAGCSWCDLETETAYSFQPKTLRTFLRPAKLMISFHDFARTPPGVTRLTRRMESWGADITKVATLARDLSEGLRVLSLTRKKRNRIAIPMGDAALPLRILALRHGAALAYASAGPPTAPGQVPLETLLRLYRADKLSRRTRVYGVIGNPIGHSLSPLLHNTGFQARRLDAIYVPFLVKDLSVFLENLEALAISGFSVTLPHKHAILRHLDDCDPLAAEIGAVNTVVVRGGGKLYGYNTDFVGVLRALERRMPLAGSRVLLLGAGGAARAVAFALARGGSLVSVCSRRPPQARTLARAVGGELVARRHLRREFFDAIINATPVGMFPRSNVSPLAPGELNCRMVMDLIYRPRKTRLLRLAERRDIATISGVEMFLAQGTAQWEIWTGLRAPQTAMRRAILAVLKQEERTGSHNRVSQ